MKQSERDCHNCCSQGAVRLTRTPRSQIQLPGGGSRRAESQEDLPSAAAWRCRRRAVACRQLACRRPPCRTWADGPRGACRSGASIDGREGIRPFLPPGAAIGCCRSSCSALQLAEALLLRQLALSGRPHLLPLWFPDNLLVLLCMTPYLISGVTEILMHVSA